MLLVAKTVAWGGIAVPGFLLATEVELQLAVPAATTPAVVEVTWEKVSRSASDDTPRRYHASVEAPGSLVLDLEPRSVWQVSITSEDFWTAAKILTVPDRTATERLTLWPIARVVGEIEVERTEAIPTEIDIRFESPPDASHKVARSSVTCPINDRRYTCALPALRLDLRLRARGFISHYYWDAKLQPKIDFKLGKVTLRRGASVVGLVEMDDSEASFSDAKVRLEREVASAMLDEETDRRRRASNLDSTVNKRGFFELVGVPEGLYALIVEHPAFARGRYAPVQVLTNAESELYPIQLHKAVTLRVEVQPQQPTGARRWGIELYRHGESPGHLDLEVDDPMAEDGTWTSSGLAPGEYTLRLKSGAEAIWYQENLTLPTGAETILRQLDLSEDWLAGSVLLGSEPVAAELYFVTSSGTVRIPTHSDADGLFEVQVPIRETWTIDVFVREASISHRFKDVSPNFQDPEGRQWLELIIPDTLVEGTVVDGQGRPIEDARVAATGRSGGQTQRSEADGAFTMRGLRPGKYWLSAESANRQRRSEILEIEVEPDEQLLPIELVITDDRRIDGQVVDPSGQGVVGAQVVGLIEQSHERPIAFVVPEAITDLTGSFSITLPTTSEGVLLTAFPPGLAARQIRIDSRSNEPVFIPTEPHGGTLRIQYEEPVQRDWLVIFKTWKLPSHFVMTNWASLNGEPNTTPGVYTLPMLEPGYYQVCTDPTYMYQISGRLEPELEGRCQGGFLPAYGELVVDVHLPRTSSRP